MKIGIDLDEVTAEFLQHFLDFYNNKNGTNFEEDDFKSYHFYKVVGGTLESDRKLLREFHKQGNLETINPSDDAVDSLKKLNSNNELVIITARPLEFKEATEKWIQKNIGLPIKVIFSGEFGVSGKSRKSKICREEGISVILEDNSDYALDCAEDGINVILFDKPWNQNISHKNIFRVGDWKEALQKLKSFE